MLYRRLLLLLFLYPSGPLWVCGQEAAPFSPEEALASVRAKLAHFEAEGPADSVVFYYQRQAGLVCQLDRLDDWLYSYWDLQAYFYEDAERALSILETALRDQWRSPATPAEWEAQLWMYTNQGYQSFQSGRVLASARAYERAAGVFEARQIADFDIVGYVYLPLIAHYTRLGDNERARSVFRRALDRGNLPPDVLGGLYNNLGLTYWDEGDFENAERQFAAGLAVAGLPPEKEALLWIGRGRNADALGKTEEAEVAARRALALLADLPAGEAVLDYRSGAQVLLGALAAERSAFREAETWFEQAVASGVAAYGSPHHRTIGKIFLAQGRSRLRSGDGEGALRSANQALRGVLPAWSPRQPEDLPPPELFYEENTIIEALEVKADALGMLASQRRDTAGLRLALDGYERALAVGELLSGTFRYESARLLLQSKNRARTEKALALAYRLREEAGVPRRAFALAEQSKASVLLAAIRDNLARREIQQGDTLLTRERELRRLRAYYQKELILGDDPDRRAALERGLAETTDALAALKVELYQRYPRLNALEAPERPAAGADARSSGTDSSALLIEYFTGRDHLFGFRMDTAGAVAMVRLDSTEKLRAPLFAFLQLLRSRNELSARRADYVRLGRELYGRLLEPLLPSGQPGPAEVVLVPDGQLSFLPFEALITGEPATDNWAALPYVLKKVPLRYAYSLATLRRQSELKATPAGNVLEVAPGFAKGERGLAPLLGDGPALGATDLGRTETLRGEAATTAALEARAGDFRVLHLSTHAQVDSAHTQPRIELIDAPLYLPQVYALNLRAELVTLSACETGLGNLAEGEGVMSLARGFAYAGAAGLVSSLWAVNEQSTARLFDRFYGHLADGMPKGRALHQAKLDYLDGDVASFQKSPYYWAGFLLVGDGEAIPFKEGWRLWKASWVATGILVVLLMGYQWLRSRHKKAGSSGSKSPL